ncbi:hypothetical protein RIF29_19807 [Crotalaria pallida]|uniref:Phospholipid/glycerol acyltransferase domain-containing protein n=1 Tax=Crotalaria pallida TaxID=3830 RepID=A0AAN9I4G6_CROPI
MNPNYNDFRFPQFKAHPWYKIFHKRMPPEAIDLASRLLQYSPSLRCSALEACAVVHTLSSMNSVYPMLACRMVDHFHLFSTLTNYQWIKRKGRPAPREFAPVIVSNHVSYIEPIFYFYELFATIVAYESHDSLPFVGTIVRAMQVLTIIKEACYQGNKGCSVQTKCLRMDLC